MADTRNKIVWFELQRQTRKLLPRSTMPRYYADFMLVDLESEVTRCDHYQLFKGNYTVSGIINHLVIVPKIAWIYLNALCWFINFFCGICSHHTQYFTVAFLWKATEKHTFSYEWEMLMRRSSSIHILCFCTKDSEVLLKSPHCEHCMPFMHFTV